MTSAHQFTRPVDMVINGTHHAGSYILEPFPLGSGGAITVSYQGRTKTTHMGHSAAVVHASIVLRELVAGSHHP